MRQSLVISHLILLAFGQAKKNQGDRFTRSNLYQPPGIVGALPYLLVIEK